MSPKAPRKARANIVWHVNTMASVPAAATAFEPLVVILLEIRNTTRCVCVPPLFWAPLPLPLFVYPFTLQYRTMRYENETEFNVVLHLQCLPSLHSVRRRGINVVALHSHAAALMDERHAPNGKTSLLGATKSTNIFHFHTLHKSTKSKQPPNPPPPRLD